MVAQTAMGVMGANAEAKGQQNIANQQAQVADRNAQIARQDTDLAAEGEERSNRGQISQARARLSRSGVDTSSGSPAAALEQMRRDLAHNVDVTRYEGRKSEIGATDDAAASRAAGKTFRSAGRTNAVNSLLSGGIGAYDANSRGLFKKTTPGIPAVSAAGVPGDGLTLY